MAIHGPVLIKAYIPWGFFFAIQNPFPAKLSTLRHLWEVLRSIHNCLHLCAKPEAMDVGLKLINVQTPREASMTRSLEWTWLWLQHTTKRVLVVCLYMNTVVIVIRVNRQSRQQQPQRRQQHGQGPQIVSVGQNKWVVSWFQTWHLPKGAIPTEHITSC